MPKLNSKQKLQDSLPGFGGKENRTEMGYRYEAEIQSSVINHAKNEIYFLE